MNEVRLKVSKKAQIAALLQLGISSIEELASLTHTRPSYIANILHEHQLLDGYFDLYTSSTQPMNVYSKFFTKRLGFKNTATARHSVDVIDTLYQQFARIGDRAGQHHAMLMALTMRNRAAWSGKSAEAAIFSQWLIHQLKLPEPLEAVRISPATAHMQRHLNNSES